MKVKLSKPRCDISGAVYGRLTVIRFSHYSQSRRAFWDCLCSCGTEKVIDGANLKAGKIISCGCRLKEIANANSQKHRRKHGLSRTPEYRSWRQMLSRCYNQNHEKYHLYGGRGVEVCERWRESFESFLADMGKCDSDGSRKTIDRIDTNGHYEPLNCRWSTQKEQMRNTRRNVFITANGITMILADWSEKYGVPADVISWRIGQGWSPERAVSAPCRKFSNKPAA